MLKLLAFVACLIGVHSTIIDIFEQTNGQEPRVAINCGKVPFFVDLETGAWIADKEGKTLCDEESKEVVKSYCQKIYPKLNVTNIVESNKPVIFNNWCSEGSKDCHAMKQVVPYRCLVHEYEADALMVPNGCTFDHLHDANKCMAHDEWKVRAKDKCHETDMRLKEYGILLSCGTDLFTGVEFVCCPKPKPKEVEKKKQKQKNLEKKLKTLLKKEKQGKISQKQREEKQKKIEKKLQKKTERDDKALGRAISEFEKFIPSETVGCDRAQFVVKETSMQERHRNRIAAVVEEWDEAEKRYNKLKAKDPVTAEEKMKRTLEVFRETLAALEEEAKEEKSRLRVEHASCINIDISKQKHDAMMDYIASVEEKPADSDRILRSVRKFIQVCEHDRVHSLRHFEHVRNRDPEKAKNMRGELLAHLKELNTVVNSSMGLLNYLPKIAQQFGLGDVGVMLKPRLVMPQVDPIIPHDHEELPEALKPDYVADKKSDGTREPIDELPAFQIDEAPATEEVAPATVPNNPVTEKAPDGDAAVAEEKMGAVFEQIPVEEKPESLDNKEEQPEKPVPITLQPFDTTDEEEAPTKEEFLPTMLGNKDEVPEEFLPKKTLGNKDEVPKEFLPKKMLGHKDEMPKEFLPKKMLGHKDEMPKEFLPKKEELPEELPEATVIPILLGEKDEVPEEFLPKHKEGHKGHKKHHGKKKHHEPKKSEEEPKEKRHHIHEYKRSAGFAAVIGLSCGALVIMLGILIALIVRRKRSAAHHHVVIPTDENDDQEHLVQMQKKGFENPTYKFYYY